MEFPELFDYWMGMVSSRRLVLAASYIPDSLGFFGMHELEASQIPPLELG